MITVTLPPHLRALVGVHADVKLDVAAPITICSVLDSLETAYPMLRGTIREYGTRRRRAFVRFFACEVDVSHIEVGLPLPEEIADGREPFMIVGAISGG